MHTFFYMLNKTIESSEFNHNKKLEDFCYKVKDFVQDGSFTSYDRARELMSYMNESDSFTAQMMGLTAGTVKQTRYKRSIELYEIFGYDFFNVISAGDSKAIEEGERRLHLAIKSYKSTDFLYRELISTILSKGDVDSSIDISTCAKEIQFLVKYSKQSIERDIQGLDYNKLVYLIKMLDNEEGTPLDIRNLIKLFERRG